MSAAVQLLRNISSNYLKVGVDAVILVLLTPYIVNELGSAMYAVWVIALTLGYYLGFLDLGVADAQVQRHSLLAAQGATTELGRLHGTVMAMFIGAGVAALLISFVLIALPTADWFDIPTEARKIYDIVLPLIGLSVLFSFGELGINGVFEGYQRFDVTNAIDIVLTVIEAVATFAVLYAGWGLIGLAAVKGITDGFGLVTKTIVARRMFPAYAFPKVGFDPAVWQSIRSFSLWNSLNDLMTEGTANLDKLLIPILLGSALLTPYSLAVMLAAAIFVVAEPITGTFFPIAARRHGSSDVVALRVLLVRGSKLVNVITLPTLVVVLCFGDTVLDLWIGEEHTDIAPTVLWLTASNFYFSTYLWTSISILSGSGRVKMLFWVSLLEVALTLVLIIALTPSFGLSGLVFAGLVTNIAIGLSFFIVRACQMTGTPVWPFLLKTLVLPLVAILPALVLGLWLFQELRPDGWIDTGLCALITGLVGMLSAFFTLTGRWERLRYRVTLRRIVSFAKAS